jgi:hypothetical protein
VPRKAAQPAADPRHQAAADRLAHHLDHLGGDPAGDAGDDELGDAAERQRIVLARRRSRRPGRLGRLAAVSSK